MGTQKQIAQKIRESGADYVLALKGNHEIMFEEVRRYLLEAKGSKNFGKEPHDFLETVEKGHGRIETRRYWITEDIGWFADKDDWMGLRSFGMVESIREINGEQTTEIRFFIASIGADAKNFARAVRGYWPVENFLHWCLDVCFGEDQCRVRCGHAAENLSILRHMTLNILKRDTTKKRGIKGKQKNAGWNYPYLLSLLNF